MTASVACVVQARTGSTRLPGKVLLDVAGRPLLEFLLGRLATGGFDRVVVATSDLAADDPIASLAEQVGVPVVRGSESDVLARFSRAMDEYPGEHVVRLTADSPLVDPAIVHAAIEHHLEVGADYTSNTLARTYPDGLDVEVIRADVLRTAASEGRDADEREHVTPFVYRRPDRFALATLCSGDQLGAERWTVDTAADLDHIRAIVQRLDDPVGAGWREVLAASGRAAADPEAVWLRPYCWPGLDFRRRWDAMLGAHVVGATDVELVDVGVGIVHYEGASEHEQPARQLTRHALTADKQVAVVTDDR